MLNKKQNQQGDVTFEIVDAMPIGVRKAKSNILALGEATGHAHKVVSPDTEVWEFGGQKFLVVPDGSTGIIEHSDEAGNGDHHTTVLQPGIHRVGRVLEYDHFSEEARQVAD